MNGQGLFTLGFNIEYVFLGIWVLVMVGGWVTNQSKEAKKKKQVRDRNYTDSSSTAASRDDSLTATELAQKRREQLQKLSRQRQAKIQSRQSPTSSQSHGHPSNLSPAEAVRREAAQSAYDLRAEELRKQTELHRQQRLRQREITRQRAEQQQSQQKSQAQRQRQSTVRTQQPQSVKRTTQPPVQQRTTSRPPKRKSRSITRQPLSTTQIDTIQTDSIEHRGVSNAGTTTVASLQAPNKTLARLLSGHSIQSAIIWKEILDKPLAMREQDPFAI